MEHNNFIKSKIEIFIKYSTIISVTFGVLWGIFGYMDQIKQNKEADEIIKTDLESERQLITDLRIRTAVLEAVIKELESKCKN